MALKANSNEVREAVKKHIYNGIEDVNADCLSSDVPCTSAWDMYQCFKFEKADEIARYGETPAFKSWVQGLCGFFDLMQAKQYVMEWLQETPDEADQFSNTESEEFYMNLCWREFHELVDVSKQRGLYTDCHPHINHLGNLAYDITLFKDGKHLATVADIESARSASYLQDWIEFSVHTTGDIPSELVALSCSPAADVIPDSNVLYYRGVWEWDTSHSYGYAMRAFIDQALPFILKYEKAWDELDRKTDCIYQNACQSGNFSQAKNDMVEAWDNYYSFDKELQHEQSVALDSKQIAISFTYVITDEVARITSHCVPKDERNLDDALEVLNKRVLIDDVDARVDEVKTDLDSTGAARTTDKTSILR